MRVIVYLTDNVVADRSGRRHAFPQERLVRQGPGDRVLAVIEAPPGSRIRRKADRHGPESLRVPESPGLWARLFGRRHCIPAKYLIQEARLGAFGLLLRGGADAASRPPAPGVTATA